VEPGNIDCIELCPTISCSNFEYVKKSQDKPPFFEYFDGTKKQADVIYDVLQSEEGGRFYQLQNRNMLVVINDSEQPELPSNYTWMTLNRIMTFMRFEFFNIEARSLISSINFNLESTKKQDL
jgi:NDP-hexose 2,3-dehydratase.